MSYTHPLQCPCDAGLPCKRIRACAVDDMIGEAERAAEAKSEERHAAFVARVREIAENMPHDPECESLIEEWIDAPGHIGFTHPYKCDCRRGKLLEVCNG